MPSLRRRSGFTLVEVIVSVLIVVLIVGVSITTERQILQSTQASQAQAQMNNFIQDNLTDLEETQSTNSGFLSAIGLSFSTSGYDSIYGSNYNCTYNQQEENACTYTITNPISLSHTTNCSTNSPATCLDWQPFITTSNLGYVLPKTFSPVCYSSGPCTFSQFLSLTKYIGPQNNLVVTELAAAARKPGTTLCGLSEVDFISIPSKTTCTTNYLSVNAPNEALWNFYELSSQISLIGNASGGKEAFNLDDTDNTFTSVDSTDLSQLQCRDFKASVTVANYVNPSEYITRNLYLTDWENSSASNCT